MTGQSHKSGRFGKSILIFSLKLKNGWSFSSFSLIRLMLWFV
ncbi:hypothetical protein L289_1485 [Acinetobacter gerneri DSM 14967 = CIP 107464 = MTCC 9824]|nr:hypothetical protein L289_1485 [Acinetobacter gerneri DSM 14967 = CIP 107464 = MTCC 9824]